MDGDMILQGLQPLCIPQKNTQTLQIESDYTFKDGDTLYMTIKTKPDNDQTDGGALAKIAWVFGTDCNYDNEGYLELKIAAADTDMDFGNYVYDIKLVNSEVQQTIVYGPLQILPVTTLRV